MVQKSHSQPPEMYETLQIMRFQLPTFPSTGEFTGFLVAINDVGSKQKHPKTRDVTPHLCTFNGPFIGIHCMHIGIGDLQFLKDGTAPAPAPAPPQPQPQQPQQQQQQQEEKPGHSKMDFFQCVIFDSYFTNNNSNS